MNALVRRAPLRSRGSVLPQILWAVAGMIAVVLWVGGSGYRQDLMVLSCSYALVGLGMYIPFIMGGSLSAAYSAYAAIGAYTV